MRLAHGDHRKQKAWRRTRPGSVAAYALVILPVLTLALALALFATQLGETRTTLQTNADAAALAAVQVLVDDDALLGRPDILRRLMERAEEEARRFAQDNLVGEDGVDLRPNPDNDPDGDIVFGSLDRPRDKHFVVADLGEDREEFLHLINTVRITCARTCARGNPCRLTGGAFLSLRETDLVATATATLDRDVIGFRPVFDQPLPLIPLALLSDPAGANQDSWEYQVEKRGGHDRWRLDKVEDRRKPAPGPDGLFEMEVQLGSAGGGRTNACLLQLGAYDRETLDQQLCEGVRPEHLANFGGELVLGQDNKLVVPGNPWGCPAPGTSAHARLCASLEKVRRQGEARIWPLFRGLDDRTGMPALNGFVAARVVHVGGDQEGSQGLSFVLQPCMISSAAAVTSSSRRESGGKLPNPYLCKVRLVE
jgi:hypothetical protein